ncbi:hypothetical protein Micbo1qcDRAFT_191187 [Microdochium bolleyi]|uniref:Peptidyl-tRNA hydrolase n=1 Tax=Microdochium bolleyi TaxID=196109 RepID=A0A136JGX3_9PEZI|nr:hypothetical protein Micbo1qcDRAFT_191187 [Microdochium bolleyi]
MRFSTAAAAVSLPLLAAAEGPAPGDFVQQYLGQAQGLFNKYFPNPNRHDPVGAAQAKAGEMKMHTLTLGNWNETLFSNVKPGQTIPDEWWVFITGGKKACYDHCEQTEAAWNQTAAKFAVTPGAPHTAMLSCEDQPVLCHSWSSPPGAIWAFEVVPAPQKVNVWVKGMNLTTTTSDTFVDLLKEVRAKGYNGTLHEHSGAFHPYSGWFADKGLSVAAGYAIWAMNLIPSWAFMIGISMFSRYFVGNRARATMEESGRQADARRAAVAAAANKR